MFRWARRFDAPVKIPMPNPGLAARYPETVSKILQIQQRRKSANAVRPMQPRRFFHPEGMQEVSPGSRSAPGGAEQKTRIARPRPGESRDAGGRRICVTTNQGWRCADPWLPSLTTSWSPRLRSSWTNFGVGATRRTRFGFAHRLQWTAKRENRSGAAWHVDKRSIGRHSEPRSPDHDRLDVAVATTRCAIRT